jgi:hypothetical protein
VLRLRHFVWFLLDIFGLTASIMVHKMIENLKRLWEGYDRWMQSLVFCKIVAFTCKGYARMMSICWSCLVPDQKISQFSLPCQANGESFYLLFDCFLLGWSTAMRPLSFKAHDMRSSTLSPKVKSLKVSQYMTILMANSAYHHLLGSCRYLWGFYKTYSWECLSKDALLDY